MCHRQVSGARTTRRERRKAVVSLGAAKKPKSENTPTPSWIIVDFEGRGFRCERCGGAEKHSLSSGVSRLTSFSLRGQAFAIDHADCKEKTP